MAAFLQMFNVVFRSVRNRLSAWLNSDSTYANSRVRYAEESCALYVFERKRLKHIYDQFEGLYKEMMKSGDEGAKKMAEKYENQVFWIIYKCTFGTNTYIQMAHHVDALTSIFYGMQREYNLYVWMN